MRYYKFKREIGTPAVSGTRRAVYMEIDGEGSGLLIVDAAQEEHEANLSLENVTEMSFDEAREQVAKHLPKRRVKRLNPKTREEEEVTIEAEDISVY